MMIFAPIAAGLIQMSISRSREFAADATGAKVLGTGEPLARALEKLAIGTQQIPSQREPSPGQRLHRQPAGRPPHWVRQFFSTHPPDGGAGGQASLRRLGLTGYVRPRTGSGTPVQYDESLRARLGTNLALHPPLDVADEGRRRAAVAGRDHRQRRRSTRRRRHRHGRVPPAQHPRCGQLARARRPGERYRRRPCGPADPSGVKLSAHARQWALPGGRVDPGETDLQTALRELHEELGLQLDETALLGRLDDYPTRSGYVIRPFVFWGGADPELHPDPTEVASVHRISIRELTRPARFIRIPESDRPVVQIPVGGDLIHAPTGAVLYQFRRVAVDGRFERVHHLEQPVFAWR